MSTIEQLVIGGLMLAILVICTLLVRSERREADRLERENEVLRGMLQGLEDAVEPNARVIVNGDDALTYIPDFGETVKR